MKLHFICLWSSLAILLATPSFAQQKQVSTKQLLTPQEFKACGLHKLSAIELANLDKSVNIWILAAKSIGREEAKQAKVPGRRSSQLSFADLLGGYITAPDGQFLGRITTNEIAADSLLNQIGKHGSEISRTSIFNEIGKYGSEISTLSPFNKIASKPPRIYDKSGKFVAFLTVNKIKMPRVDPHALIGWLKSQK